MATVIITGGTGMIGKVLSKELVKREHRVIILTRKDDNTLTSIPGISYATWDISSQFIDEKAIAAADYIIHLAGANVAGKRWTKKRKQEIVDSRVKSGELIVKALKEIPNAVKAVIGASAIGWYGPDPLIPNPNPFREEAPAFNDFLGNTCLQWEKSLEPIRMAGRRLIILRAGIVLSKDDGALAEFRRPLKFGVAAILGNGKQVISWIHIDDLVRLYIAAMENEKMEGVYNAVAPTPVSNKELVLQLARLKKGKFFIPVYVPAFALRLVLGEMSIEVLKSATVSCTKAHVEGFTFLYPSLESALRQL